MRIGVDARCLRPLRLRGIGRYLHNTIRYCRELRPDWEWVLFQDSRYENHDHFAGLNGIEYCRFATRGDRFLLWEQVGLPKHARRTGVDLLHSPANTMPLFNAIPSILTLHDTLFLDFEENETKGMLFYLRRILPIAARRADRVVTVSDHSKKDIVKRLGVAEEKVITIHHGRDPAFVRLEDRSKVNEALLRLGLRRPYLLAFGAAIPRKNTARIIEAVAGLAPEFPDLQLVVAGPKEEIENEHGALIRGLGFEDRIVLPGFISEEDLVLIYNGAEALLYPSLYEGFGFPILEAMSCGCPVVTSSVSSMPEVIDDAELTVDSRDVNAIAATTAKLMKDREFRSAKIEHGLRRARDFDWHKSAAKMVGVYEEAISRRGSPAMTG